MHSQPPGQLIMPLASSIVLFTAVLRVCSASELCMSLQALPGHTQSTGSTESCLSCVCVHVCVVRSTHVQVVCAM